MQYNESNKELLRSLNECMESHNSTIDILRCINERNNVYSSPLIYSFSSCLGHFIHKTALNYSLCDPNEVDCLEVIGYCIPTFLRCIFGMKNYSFTCSLPT